MPAGYSENPLVKKLGIKSGFNAYAVNYPDHYPELLKELPEAVEFLEEPIVGKMDFVHFFVKEASELHEQLPRLKALLTKSGMLWISWPKKASKVPTDVTDHVVRTAGLGAGLVDVKVCAVDKVWSGLKFVYRIMDR